MTTIVWGTVKDGCIIPSTPLPEGAKVEIRVSETSAQPPSPQDQEQWQRFGTGQLAKAYGADEPDYSESDLKPELNR